MIKNAIIITRVNEIFFTKSSDIEINFWYNYFKKIIDKYNLNGLLNPNLYLDEENRFNFKLIKISEINIKEDIMNCSELLDLEYNENKYLKDNIIFLGNNIRETQLFLFFPYYQKLDDECLYNDFILATNEDNINLDNYTSKKSIFSRKWILICLKI